MIAAHKEAIVRDGPASAVLAVFSRIRSEIDRNGGLPAGLSTVTLSRRIIQSAKRRSFRAVSASDQVAVSHEAKYRLVFVPAVRIAAGLCERRV